MVKLLRRTFLIGSVALVVGLAIGYYFFQRPVGNPLLGELDPDEQSLTPYIIIESGIIFGLLVAMMEKINFAEGKVEQFNIRDFDALRIIQVPKIEVEILENYDRISGTGEPGTSPISLALAKAFFAAIGERIRGLLLTDHVTYRS